jgi:hypothetical protein
MKDGGWVFPVLNSNGEGSAGMTLRDYFAGQALAGLASLVPPCAKEQAYRAYEYADALLAEREKQ